MRNTGLEETQAGIKIAGRNINNLRYADDTTLMAESEEDLKSLLMKVKEENEKVGLKLNSGHRTGKGQCSFQSQRKRNSKECSTYHTIPLISHANSNAQNSLSEASMVDEPRTSRCSSWI